MVVVVVVDLNIDGYVRPSLTGLKLVITNCKLLE